jgi:hypothetical protein
MDYLSLETADEMSSVIVMATKKPALYDDHNFIGAMTLNLKSTSQWYWVNSGKKTKFSLPWGTNQPDGIGRVLLIVIQVRHQIRIE